MTEPKPGYHDVGGRALGPIDQSEHTLAPWEKRVDVMRGLLGDKKRRILRADGLRHATETLGEDVYLSHKYYERWMAAIMSVLDERGILSHAEMEARIGEVAERLGVEVPSRPHE